MNKCIVTWNWIVLSILVKGITAHPERIRRVSEVDVAIPLLEDLYNLSRSQSRHVVNLKGLSSLDSARDEV